jgi:hypothetical protein
MPPLFDCWDCTAVDLPPRSRLYSLNPIGIGTSFVESVTGYVSRLADAHAVSVADLVGRELSLVGSKPVRPFGPFVPRNTTTGPHGFRGRAVAGNGLGETAKRWVGALERATLQRAFGISRCCRLRVSSPTPDYSATPAPGAGSVMKTGDAPMIQSTSPYCGQSDRQRFARGIDNHLSMFADIVVKQCCCWAPTPAQGTVRDACNGWVAVA